MFHTARRTPMFSPRSPFGAACLRSGSGGSKWYAPSQQAVLAVPKEQLLMQYPAARI